MSEYYENVWKYGLLFMLRNSDDYLVIFSSKTEHRVHNEQALSHNQ